MDELILDELIYAADQFSQMIMSCSEWEWAIAAKIFLLSHQKQQTVTLESLKFLITDFCFVIMTETNPVTEPATAPEEPKPTYVKLAMRNMVRKGGKSLWHFSLTTAGLLGFFVLMAWLTH